MADEFVDFYEALNLPLEADRKQVRQRISEAYLEAQRNLDHRDFQTRIKHQEMFEVVLPRARYILLDDVRRDEYDHLVRAFRAANAPAATSTPQGAPTQGTPAQEAPTHEKAFGQGDASGFRLAEVEDEPAGKAPGGKAPAGKAPTVDALPQTPLDPIQMAAQRDEMWAKWKQGLEAAIVHDEGDPKPAKPSSPRSEAPVVTVQPAPVQGSPIQTAPVQGSPVQAVPVATPAQETTTTAPRKPRPQAAPISFNFDNGSNAPHPDDDEDTAKAKALELERQKAEHKRAVMKEILDSVSLKGTIIGALGAAIPLGALLIFLMGRYYPRGGPQLALPSSLAWLLGIAIVLGAAFVAANELAKAMRRQATVELSMLPVEDLLRRVGRTY